MAEKRKRMMYCNTYGQIECDRCGNYSDVIRPVHFGNQNGPWISWLCNDCIRNKLPKETPVNWIEKIGDPLIRETYDGPIRVIQWKY